MHELVSRRAWIRAAASLQAKYLLSTDHAQVGVAACAACHAYIVRLNGAWYEADAIATVYTLCPFQSHKFYIIYIKLA